MRKPCLAGAAIAVAVQALIIGLALRHVPTESILGPLARILDSLAPWFLALALLSAGVAVAFGSRIAGAILSVATLVGAGWFWIGYAKLSLPAVPELEPDLRVLFINMQENNAGYADRTVTAILKADPDVVVIAEGAAMHSALPRLQEAYGFVSPCELEDCQLLVATQAQPARFWQLALNPVWPNRYAVTELRTLRGDQIFVAATHLAKPWLSGISEVELERLRAQYDWLSGPVVAVGDFNAAPWSRPVQELLAQTGYRGLRRPIPTWPARAGAFGVPIDQVLVHGGARVVSAAPFGAALNSNHRGLLVEITLAAP